MKVNLKIVFLLLLFSTRLISQSDSSKKIRFSGVQLELNGIGVFNSTNMDLQNFKNLNPTDSLVNKDFSKYGGGYGNNSSFNGIIAGRVFLSLPKKYKLGIDVYTGFIFYKSSLGSTGYYKSKKDTTNFFIGIYPNTNQGFYQFNETNYGYNFDLSATFIQLPFGINFNTNKQKRFWFNFGLEFAPGLTFNHTYTSVYSKNSREYLSDPANNNVGFETFSTRFSSSESYITTKKLGSIGFVGHLTAPLSMQIRCSKRIKFLKHLNLVSTIAPGVYLTSNNYSGTKTNVTTNLILGLRYNL